MKEEIMEYLIKYPAEIIGIFTDIRQLIFDSTDPEPEEKLWAKLPSYFCGGDFVRLIPFRDHINIEARAAVSHMDELSGYRFTPKGMLQIYIGQDIPVDILKRIFTETLGRELT